MCRICFDDFEMFDVKFFEISFAKLQLRHHFWNLCVGTWSLLFSSWASINVWKRMYLRNCGIYSKKYIEGDFHFVSSIMNSESKYHFYTISKGINVKSATLWCWNPLLDSRDSRHNKLIHCPKEFRDSLLYVKKVRQITI